MKMQFPSILFQHLISNTLCSIINPNRGMYLWARRYYFD